MPDDDPRRRPDASGACTCAEVGATRAPTLPAGHDHVRRTRVVGRGAERFRASAEALLTWEVHRGAGLTVRASGEHATPRCRGGRRLTASSTPALWWSRLGAPVTRRVQRRITDRYVRAVEQVR